MRRTLVAVLAAAALTVSALAGAGAAQAVRYGEPDSKNTYSGVGLMVLFDDGVPQWRCTGALVSSTVFLTAGHCTENPTPANGDQTSARVWFDWDVQSVADYPLGGGDSFVGKPASGPGWTGALALPDTGDVGRVVFTDPIPAGHAVYPMAAPGTLDALVTKRGLQDTSFTVVGYGLQQVKPEESRLRIRMIGQVQVKDLRSSLAGGYNLGTTNAPGKGTGGSGTCFGDSGGPVFYQGEIVGVNSFVLNENCTGSSYAYRVDRAPVQSWVLSSS